MALPENQKAVPGFGNTNLLINSLYYPGSGTVTFEVDGTASQVNIFAADGQTAGTVALGSASATTGEKTVTISAGGAGYFDVITWHPGPLGGWVPTKTPSAVI